MSIWASARALLNNAVIGTLGEAVTFSKAGEPDVQIQAQLLQPETRAKLGNADYVFADAIAVVKEADAPAWLARGVLATTEGGRVFSVTQYENNGEGLVEITLTRRST